MEQVDMILRCKYLITMTDDSLKEDYSVVIKDGKILDVLPLEESEQKYYTNYWRYLTENIVMPGFVNSHNHSPMLFFRGLIPEGTKLDDVLYKYMFPIEAKCSSDPEFVYHASKAAAIEMLNAGTTTTAEMYYHADAMIEAFKEIGIRAIVGETIMSVKETPSAKDVNESIRIATKAKMLDNDLVKAAIAPHAFYTVDENAMKICSDSCKDLDMRMLMHANESSLDLINGIGALKYYSDKGFFSGIKTTMAHCCNLDLGELNAIESNNIGVSVNPVSNALIGNPMAPIDSIVSRGLRLGLGSDGPMTNDAIDMLSQLKPAMLLYLASGNDINSYKILQMATIGSAKALHLDDKIGTIEKGKDADIIGLDISEKCLPYIQSENIFQYIVRYAKANNVMFTMIKGKAFPLLHQDKKKNSEMLSRVKLK